MLPGFTLPASLAGLLAAFQPCFTAPTFTTFCALVYGMFASTGQRTVCGMLVGAGLSRLWRHDRAHRFFSEAAWSADDVGLILARLVVRLLVPAGGAVTVAVDDTLFHRTGKKVHAAGWFHDGSGKGKDKVGYGNNWVIAGIVVAVPVLGRVVCLPVLARLVNKDTDDFSRLGLAVQMLTKIAEALPGRTVHGVGDAAYAGKELCNLPKNVTFTTRMKKNADLYKLPPPRTGRPGRPRLEGDELPGLEQIAFSLAFTPATVVRYGKKATVYVSTFGYSHNNAQILCYAESGRLATPAAVDLQVRACDRQSSGVAPGVHAEAATARLAARSAQPRASRHDGAPAGAAPGTAVRVLG